MQQRFVSAFHCDKSRLLDRNRNHELWEAYIHGKRYLVKSFFAPRHQLWPEFEEQSRIHNHIFLNPTLAGYTRKGIFCHAIPVDFQPERVSPETDLSAFIIHFLALALALEKRGLAARWSPNHLVRDPCTGKVMLAGFHSLRHISTSDTNDYALKTITALAQLAATHQCAPEVVDLLKNWERRKEVDLASCLKKILNEYSYTLELLRTCFEWIHSKELEIAGGLFQLAERRRGRAILFAGDRGEGKSTLLRQLYRHLSPRNCMITYFSAESEERPLQSFRSLLDSFFENVSAYTIHKRQLDPVRLMQVLEKSSEGMMEQFVSKFLHVTARFAQRKKSIFVFLIDDVHLFDPVSLKVISTLFEKVDSTALLFLMTAPAELAQLAPSVLTLSFQSGSAMDFERAHAVPLWKEEQKQHYLEQIYLRTSGNPLLYADYLHQTLRQRQSQLSWEDGSWAFQQSEIPAFPNVLLDFYLQQIPPITAEELSFLEVASIQGEMFDPYLCEPDPVTRETVLQSLSEKAVLYHSNGRVGFRKPLLSEALHQRIEPGKRRRLHGEVAAELLKLNRSEQTPAIADHFLKAGDFAHALSFASAAAEDRLSGANPLMPIFEELNRLSDHLDAQQKLQLFLARGSLFFRRGSYTSAIEDYTKALLLQNSDQEAKFSISMKIAQAYVLNNDIFSAQRVLQEQSAYLSAVTNRRLLLDFYLARDFCLWHRGERLNEDFQKAMEIAEKLQDYDALAKGFRQRAELKLKEGATAEARIQAEKAMKYCQKTGNLEESGQCLRILGSISWRQSKYKSAEQLLRKSVRALQKVENQEGTARAWSVLGNIYSERYQFRKAVEAFQNAARLFSREHHPYETSLAQFNLGLVYVDQGNLKEAERIFVRCRLADKQTGNKRFFAYDLRALAVVCILRGFYKKAARLLKRTLEICEDLNAEGDILQTKMLSLFNELEQRNYRHAAPLVEFIQNKLPEQEDEKTQAEMHYLLAHYFGFINDSKASIHHLDNAAKIARRIRYFKLIGQTLILKLIFRNSIPARNDRDLKRAVDYFSRSRNELEFCMYILKLYQAYPTLAKHAEHSRRLLRMENLYRDIRNRPNHRIVRHLMRGVPSQKKSHEQNYEWTRELLEIIGGKDPLSERLSALLVRLMKELHGSRAVFRYLNGSGMFEKVCVPQSSNSVEDLEDTIFSFLLEKREPYFAQVAATSDLAKHPWVILSDVTSILAIPLVSVDQITGCLYLERQGDVEPFGKKEQGKASFFLMAAMPMLEQAFRAEAARKERDDSPVSISYGDLIGSSKSMRELYEQMAKAAPVDISVLITGESGTGKELVARSLHHNSCRSRATFLALNCSALPETLIESELFGYNKGAFTGAVSSKIGLIERAHGGTLFLDEVGDLSPAAQAKLLRVMQEREIQRLGDTSVRKVDVRFLFATHKDLRRLVKEGAYREDLLYRISVYTLLVPSLRERKEDIPLLLRYFTAKYCQNFGKSQITFSAQAMRVICQYSWPGNVRELENIVQLLLVNADSGSTIEISDLPSQLISNEGLQKFRGKSLDEARREFEREFLLNALKRNKWNKTHAAKELKLTRQGLVNLINRLEITDSDR